MVYIKQIITVFAVLFLSFIAFSQNKGKIYLENADCESAIFLEDSIFGPFNYHGGFGSIQEFDSKDSNSFYSFTHEHNSAWYVIEAKKNGFLYFDIESTAKKNDDINFLLYEEKNDSVCSQIVNNTLKPIRSNLAINDIQSGYSTGLDLTKAESFVKKGQPSVYSQAVEVKTGEQFVLVVDHESKAHTGHQLSLHYFTKAHTNEAIIPKDDNHISLNVNTFDKLDGKPLDINLEIDGISKHKPYISENAHHFTYIIEKHKIYNIHCTYKGFMLYSGEYEAPNDSNTATLNLQLQPITAGAKVSLYNIRFKPNTSKILQSSEPELITLVKFLEKNPKVKVRIIGHVNAPGQKNSGKAKAVSRTRAEAVKHYLIKNGIKGNRVKHTGKGNAEMIYPKPIDHEQERANRRVEIEIISK